MGKFTIIAITETWLDFRVNDSELINSSYSVYRRDREDVLGDKTGGGVALCRGLYQTMCFRADLEPSEEVVICVLRPENHSKIPIILAYRPPSDDINTFLDNMNPILRSAMTIFNNVCFLGDFNMNNIDWETLLIAQLTTISVLWLIKTT